MHITVIHCPAEGPVDTSLLDMEAGATLLDALRASGVLQRHPVIDVDRDGAGVWGRQRPLDTRLRDRDRVEVYRPLTIDPKDARRRRAAATCSPKR